jgi:rare lipoprotein A
VRKSNEFKAPAAALTVALASAAALSGCSQNSGSSARPDLGRAPFTEKEYGVSSSPRVVTGRGPVRKGGGVRKLGAPYKVAGKWYVPRDEPGYDRTGNASWYGFDFHGRKTANGEIFDKDALSAAHPTLPMPSYAYVTNLDNNRTILVRINDRGPYVAGRIIDLSQASATALGYRSRGTARVRVRYAGPAPLNGDDSRERQHLAAQPWPGQRGPAVTQTRQPDAGRRMAEQPLSSPRGTWSPTAYRSGLTSR